MDIPPTIQNGKAEINEISRQLNLLRGERWSRNILSVVSLLFTTLYVPLWIVALCIVGTVACDVLGMRYMRALAPKRHHQRYHAVAAFSFFREFFYNIGAAFTWLYSDDYGQALAVGMIMSQLMQLAVVRASHLYFGYVGLISVALCSSTVNTYYWFQVDQNPLGLALSSVAIICALGYTVVAMHSNSRLHKISAADRAEALESNKAKSRFLAQMSHELRTPLNAILGMGHAELRRNKDTLSQNRLSVLIASAEGLSTILDDILDMSAVEAGRLPIRLETVVPRDEILATVALFQPTATAAGLTIEHDLAEDLGNLRMIDPQRLRQCLSNLLSNALKNTAQGGVSISARMDTEQGMLRIEVADTGPGIPSAMHRTIFEPFSQARNPGDATVGNGLGLSICRSMARHMGGNLELAANAPGQSGARFILTLRADPAPASHKAPPPGKRPPQPRAPRHAPPPVTSTIASGLQVLVIDDISTNRLVASTYLRMLGASMIEAASGTQALEMLTRALPDLILLDLNMPGMNGMQTLKRIRAMPGPAGSIPVIAMTADAMPEQRQFYLSQGIDGYLAKPINPARIEMEIKAVMDKRAPKPSD